MMGLRSDVFERVLTSVPGLGNCIERCLLGHFKNFFVTEVAKLCMVGR